MHDEHIEAASKPRHRWFNPYRYPRTDRAKAAVAEVVKRLQAYEDKFEVRKRARRASDQETFEATVAAICCDLMHTHLIGYEEGLAITRSNRTLGRRSRYRPRAYGKTLPAVLDLMEKPEMGFLRQALGHKGYFGPAQVTTIHPAACLLNRLRENDVTLDDLGVSKEEELIVLKRTKEDYWDEGGLQEYEDTAETRRFREQLATINAWLESAEIDFDEAVVEDGRVIDATERRLRRVFTQGRLDSGGRLFGGFWQELRKRERLEGLHIAGEEVASLDYSQMNPRILYGLAGARPTEQDAYLLPGLEHYRPGVKKVFNSMVFAVRLLTRMPKGTRQLFPARTSVREVVGKIMDAHPALHGLFHRGMGHEAQFVESQIMVDLLLDLMERGIVALPVHDAVVVPRSRRQEVAEVMLRAFQRHTGVEGQVEEE